MSRPITTRAKGIYLSNKETEIPGQFPAHGDENNPRDENCPEYDVGLIAHILYEAIPSFAAGPRK
jgi:hypothetical protein